MTITHDCLVCGCSSYSRLETGEWACDECGQQYFDDLTA